MRTLSITATIALFAASAAPAFAADTSVAFADLDLATPAGKAELDSRISKVANTLCSPGELTGSRMPVRADRACIDSVRKEIAAKLDARISKLGAARQQVARSN